MSIVFICFCLALVVIAVWALIDLVRAHKHLKLWTRRDTAFERITMPFLAFLKETDDPSKEAWQAYCAAHGIDYAAWRAEAALHHAQVYMTIDQKGGEG